MDDLNIYVILLNCAYIIVLAAYIAKNGLAEVTHYCREYPSFTLFLIFHGTTFVEFHFLGFYLYFNQLDRKSVV